MKKIIFVCHGNICRSVAAEYIAKNISKDYIFISRATSFEEIGNDIYPPMKEELRKNNIPFCIHHAKRIEDIDVIEADYIFYMDQENYCSLSRRFPNATNIYPIYMYSENIYEIEDPWYTGRFDIVVKQLKQCIEDILNNINDIQ